MAETEETAVLGGNNNLLGTTSDLASRIQRSLHFICKNSTNLPEVLVLLISYGLLSQRESDVIESEKSSYDSFRKLFAFLIPKVGDRNVSQQVLDAFQKSGNEHILKELKNPVVTKNVVPTAPDTSFQSARFNVQNPVPSFVGKEYFIRKLHQKVLQRWAAVVSTISTIFSSIFVVTGHGGIGKTETVRKYIQAYGHCYQHVVWIDAEEHNTAENQFRKLALQELKLPTKDLNGKDKDFDVLVKDVYERLCTGRTLVVLDNAEAFHDSDPQRHGVARFLPTSLPSTHLKPVVLITSRRQISKRLHSFRLPLLTLKESREFLFRQLPRKECHATDAETLSETFGGLPLALQAAAAHIIQESERNELMGKGVYTIQHLLSDYKQGNPDILKKLPPDSTDAPPLMLLWNLSLNKIRQQQHGHLAIQILNIMAHLSPTNIPKDFLFFIFKSEDSASFVDAVELLVNYSFVHKSGNHFSIHRMLQDVTLGHIGAVTEDSPNESLLLTQPLERITTSLKKYWPTLPRSSEDYDAVHDNLVYVTKRHVLPKAQKVSDKSLRFISFLKFVLKEIIDINCVEAEKWCRLLINHFTCAALPSHPVSNASPAVCRIKPPNCQEVYFRLKLVWILERMGRFKEGVHICKELLSSFNSLEDQTDHLPRILDTKHHLGSILGQQGQYKEAIELLSSVLELRSKLRGPNHPSTLVAKHNLAVALQKSGRLSEANTLYAEILEVEMKDLGPLHRSTLTTKHNKATLLIKEGRYDDAMEKLREVLELNTKQLGPVHPDTLETKYNIGVLYLRKLDFEKAESILKEVLATGKATLPSNHPIIKNAQKLYDEARLPKKPWSLWSGLLSFFK